jgi:hypothetical protein
VPLALLVHDVDDGQDDQAWQQPEPAALIDLVDEVEAPRDGPGEDREERNRQAEQEKEIVATDQPHGEVREQAGWQAWMSPA